MQYSIGETAKKMNISTATLRYYDKEGLPEKLRPVRHWLRAEDA